MHSLRDWRTWDNSRCDSDKPIPGQGSLLSLDVFVCLSPFHSHRPATPDYLVHYEQQLLLDCKLHCRDSNIGRRPHEVIFLGNPSTQHWAHGSRGDIPHPQRIADSKSFVPLALPSKVLSLPQTWKLREDYFQRSFFPENQQSPGKMAEVSRINP